MDELHLPIAEFLAGAIRAAEYTEFVALAVVLAREAEAGPVFEIVEKQWASIDDVTHNQIMVLVPTDATDHKREAAVVDPLPDGWEFVTNCGLIAPTDRPPLWNDVFWSTTRSHAVKPPQDWKASITGNVTDSQRFLDLPAKVGPCIALLVLGERKILGVRLQKTSDPYAIFNAIMTEWNSINEPSSVSRSGGARFSEVVVRALEDAGFRQDGERIANVAGQSWQYVQLRPAEMKAVPLERILS